MNQVLDKNSQIFQGATDWDKQSKILLKDQFGRLPVISLRLEIGKETELFYRIGLLFLKTHEVIKTFLKKLTLNQ